jgi:hypothetical protein
MATPTLSPKVRYKTPAVCHKSCPPDPPIPDIGYPQDVSGFATWIDPDPLNPADLSATLHGIPLTPTGPYVGNSPGSTDFFTFTLAQDPFTQLWIMTLIIHGQRIPPEDHIFQAFSIDLTVPFDTGLQYESDPINYELREFQLTM